MAQKDPCPPVHRLHDQPPQKGAGARGARTQREISIDLVGKKPGRGADTSARIRPAWPRQKKKALERCF